MIEKFGYLEKIKSAHEIYKKASILDYSDAEIDKLFCLLNELPSPIKEEAFVSFCLRRSGRQDLLHLN